MKQTPSLTLTALLELIEKARNAELRRDTVSLREILEPLWEDITVSPDYGFCEEMHRAELLRLSGVFLSFHGLAKNLEDIQVKGKNLLTNAIEEFVRLGAAEKAVEAKINLAFCYLNLGERLEADTYLEVAEGEFGKDLNHPLYLQIQVNRLLIWFYAGQFEKGLQKVKEIEHAIKRCDDRLRSMFHTQTGILNRAVRRYDKAEFHLQEAIKFAKKAGIGFYVAMNFNNLAFLYKEKADFRKSLECVEKSIRVVEQIKHRGFLPNALDTKASILFDLGKLDDALVVINEALELFYKGEEFRPLTDALWSKIKILHRLGKNQESYIVFAELLQIAREKIGDIAVQKFSKLMDELQSGYKILGLKFDDEVKEFQKSLVRDALEKTNGKIGEAAEILGLDHRRLSEMTRKSKRYENLRTETKVKERARRGSKKLNLNVEIPPPRYEKSLYKKTLESKDIFYESEIAEMSLDGMYVGYDFEPPRKPVAPYYFDKFAMRRFGVMDGAVVAVAKKPEFRDGMFILIKRNDSFFIVEVRYEKLMRIFVIYDDRGVPCSPAKDEIIGEPFGYCPFSDAEENFIEFSRLKIK